MQLSPSKNEAKNKNHDYLIVKFLESFSTRLISFTERILVDQGTVFFTIDELKARIPVIHFHDSKERATISNRSLAWSSHRIFFNDFEKIMPEDNTREMS